MYIEFNFTILFFLFSLLHPSPILLPLFYWSSFYPFCLFIFVFFFFILMLKAEIPCGISICAHSVIFQNSFLISSSFLSLLSCYPSSTLIIFPTSSFVVSRVKFYRKWFIPNLRDTRQIFKSYYTIILFFTNRYRNKVFDKITSGFIFVCFIF